MTADLFVKIILLVIAWAAVDVRMALHRLVKLYEARERREQQYRG
jgi:hypothetical protein